MCKRNRLFRRSSITANIIISFLSITLGITLVLATLSYAFTLYIAEFNAARHTDQLLTRVNSDIEIYMSYMENISDFILSNPDVREYTETDVFASPQDEKRLEQKITSQLNGILKVRADISNIIIFKRSGGAILNKSYLSLNPYADYTEKSWYQKALAAGGRPVISSSYVQNVVADDYRWVISLSRAITNSNGYATGVILIDLKYDTIMDLCQNITLGDSGYVYVLDDKGEIVYHPTQQLLYSNIKQEPISQILNRSEDKFTLKDGDRNITVITSGLTGWKIAGVYYKDELLQNRFAIALAYLCIGLLFAVAAMALSVSISRRLSRPVRQLIDGMKKAQKGDFTTRINVETNDEISQAAQVFNTMVGRINQLMETGRKNLEARRKSEIKALQAQINPHFLYNTLDTIIWMAEDGRSEDVVELTMALAGLFRASISEGEEIIPLKQEIDHIKAYLTIQKMRYQDRLRYEINIPDGLYSYHVIKLILQPIVENAIYHGVKPKPEGGLITIRAAEDGGDLLIWVEDDGSGMDAGALAGLFSGKSNPTGGGSGIGVANVNERIKLYFGEGYGLTYESAPGKGTRVQFRLPKLT